MIDNIPKEERAPRLHAARLPTSEIDGCLHALDACDAGVAPAAPLDEEAASLRAACVRARALLPEGRAAPSAPHPLLPPIMTIITF